MLEVLYKLPSRILSKRLNDTLNTVLGPHQHGFRKIKGIQEPLLLATHAVQDATQHNKPLQLVSFDLEKAFDRVSHTIIQQSLSAFAYPIEIIEAITRLALSGQANIEVNNTLSETFQIRTGSGQGDPLSSTLFILAIEPLNRALTHNLVGKYYVTDNNITIGLLSFADDNLTISNLQNIQDFQQLQSVYSSYTAVSGLNINLQKTNVLCINTPEHLVHQLQDLGVSTPTSIKYLGIQLGTSIQNTVDDTITKIDTKSLRRRILATSTPTDMLHRAILVNRTLIPLYTHVFMALPISTTYLQNLATDIEKFMWQKHEDGGPRNKRRLVARNRLSASYTMGGLRLINVPEMNEGLQLNLIQKLAKTNSTYHQFLQVINNLLLQIQRPTLQQHLVSLGPTEWKITGAKLQTHNQLLSQAFNSTSKLLQLLENQPNSSLYAPICGHSLSPELYRLKSKDIMPLQESGLFTVSQLFVMSGHSLEPKFNRSILTLHSIQNNFWLQTRLEKLADEIIRHSPFLPNQAPNIKTTLSLLVQEKNLSQVYKKLCTIIRDSVIAVPPAYSTRQRDGIPVPALDDFINAYKVLDNHILSSKTKENAFQTLNRTLWTRNKAHKSRMQADSLCPYCQLPETMEHLLADCDAYSGPRWENIATNMTIAIRQYTNNFTASVPLTYKTILFHQEIPTFKTYKLPIEVRQATQLLIHEIRRHIYRKVVEKTNEEFRQINPQTISSHNQSVIRKVISYLTYISPLKWKEAVVFLNLIYNNSCEND